MSVFPALLPLREKYNTTHYSVRMRENTDQKNSEYGYFPRSVPQLVNQYLLNPQSGYLKIDAYLLNLVSHEPWLEGLALILPEAATGGVL